MGQVWSDCLKPTSLEDGLSQLAELAVLEIADPAMEDLRRCGGWRRPEVILLDEGYRQAP